MKLTFKKLRIKNFRSISNHTIEVDLNTNNTLITSTDNGAGKSTVSTHAICFALYGKPYGKGQKKGALVNSRNGRECLVELDFETKGKSYTVRRGIKPDLFEIYEDGNLIDQDAAKKDYQDVLNQIVSVDEKILFNSVLIGRDKFVPFAEMSAGDRRHYVENMLDLNVFSIMNEINKDDLKNINSDISLKENVIYRKNLDIQTKQSLIESLSNTKATYKQNIQNKIDLKNTELSNTEEMKKRLIDERLLINYVEDKETAEWLDKTYKAILSLDLKIDGIDKTITKTNKEISSLDTSDKCKLCGNTISVEHLITHKKELTKDLDSLCLEKEKVIKLQSELKDKYNKTKYTFDENKSLENKHQQLSSAIDNITFKIENIKKEIDSLTTDMNTPQDFDSKIKNESLLSVQLEEEVKKLDKELQESLQLKLDKETVAKTLKDDGIKASIVNEYMPYLNKKVNEYLEKLNFILNINIDKEFNIEIISPDRKGQNLADLSSGQLRRIDLSIMLAWRDIGIATSSLSTNLLILDESLENLSQQGVADFIEMFKSNFPDISLFVISQRKDEFYELFDNNIHLTMDSEGFTKIV